MMSGRTPPGARLPADNCDGGRRRPLEMRRRIARD
jgi:hypothetical protein